MGGTDWVAWVGGFQGWGLAEMRWGRLRRDGGGGYGRYGGGGWWFVPCVRACVMG